jgi:hypothetical protein
MRRPKEPPKRTTRLNIEAQYLPPKACFVRYHTPESTLANLRWQRKGPPYIKRGSRILYPRAEFEAWLASQRVL